MCCRLEWESSVRRGVTVLRRLEEERLGQLGTVASLFLAIMQVTSHHMCHHSVIALPFHCHYFVISLPFHRHFLVISLLFHCHFNISLPFDCHLIVI